MVRSGWQPGVSAPSCYRRAVGRPVTAPDRDAGFTCGEVRGGNGIIHRRVDLPGMQGVIYSRPCDGASGGDIHYLSKCGSGLMSRVCIADVAGHGSTVSAIGAEMHAHLRRSVDVIDERKVLDRFNARLEAKGLRAMTTAVLATYYPPQQRLTVCYAGHPHGWLYRAELGSWAPLRTPVPPPLKKPAFIDMPVGTGFSPTWNRHRFRVSPGDRLLLITDGVIETMSPDDRAFDTHGIEDLLNRTVNNVEELAGLLLEALHLHASAEALVHDDVTFFLAEFVDGPPGPALWHVVRNRLLQRFVR
jgi:sigma-B regulation protein RsbU (phosphoserine phosphatase)